MKDSLEVLKEDVELFTKKVNKIKEDVLKPAQKELKDSKQKYAEKLCFCKVGDKIQDPLGECFIVSNVYLKYNSRYGLRAHKLKNNGEKYKYDGDLFNWHDKWDSWKVVKE